MTSRRVIVSQIASNTVTFILLFNIFSVISHIVIDYTGPGYLVMAVPFFFLCWIWRKVVNPHIFLIWFVVVAVATVLTANYIRAGSAVYFVGSHTIMVFVVILSIRFAVIWMTGQEKEYETSTAFLLFAVHVILYAAAHFLGRENNALLTQISVTYLFMVLLILLCVHMSNIEMRMVLLQSGKASKAVLSANNRIIAVFVVAVFAVGGLVAFINPGRLFVLAISHIRALFSFFVGRRSSAEIYSPQVPLVPYEADATEYDLQELPLYLLESEAEHVRFFIDFMWIAQLIVVGALVAICLAMLSRSVTMKKRARRMASTQDTAQALETSLLDDLLGLLPRRLRLRHPVRRAYFKKVNRHIKAGVRISRSDTTDTIGEKIGQQEDIENLTAMYEKVRYGRGD